jgi:hypothetical protein
MFIRMNRPGLECGSVFVFVVFNVLEVCLVHLLQHDM